MKESDIESYVKKRVPGYLLKWVSPGESGVPDRILFLHGGTIPIEFKKPGGRLSERQKLWKERLGKLGTPVLVIGSMEEARRLINAIYTAYLPEENDKHDPIRRIYSLMGQDGIGKDSHGSDCG